MSKPTRLTRPTLAGLLIVLALLAAACGATASSPTTTEGGAPAATTTTGPRPTSTTTSTTPPATTTTAAAFPVTVAAINGKIEIPAMPRHIVSLSATHTEMLYAIGAGDQVVAVDAFSNYPDDAPITDLTGFALNVEAVIELDADLVVTDGDWDGTSVSALTELGVPVLVLPAATTLDDVYTEIQQLGEATGHVGEAAELVGQMQSDITDVLASIPKSAEPLTFYHELDSTYYSVTSQTFIGQIYEMMGLENIADAVGEGSFGYPQLSEEYILQQDPDLIFLADTICCGMDAASLEERPGWDTLTSVQNGAVVELSDDIASRWGPRVVDYMRTVSAALAGLQVNS